MPLSPEFSAKEESWGEVREELLPLFPLHWAEVGSPLALSMDFAAYRRLEDSGALLCVILRKADSAKGTSTVVGYWTLVLSPFLHSRGYRAAFTDMLFVEPTSRAGNTFSLLQKTVEKILLDKKVSLWFVGEKVKNPIGPALRRQGFSLDETVYLKRLGE